MLRTTYPRCMTPNQICLVEYALRVLAKMSPTGWEGIPVELHQSFSRYMSRDVWTGEPQPLTLRDAALMVIRDAITRTGEFAVDEY
jgi:hypothetical protein